jgi:hypothetical protein
MDRLTVMEWVREVEKLGEEEADGESVGEKEARADGEKMEKVEDGEEVWDLEWDKEVVAAEEGEGDLERDTVGEMEGVKELLLVRVSATLGDCTRVALCDLLGVDEKQGIMGVPVSVTVFTGEIVKVVEEVLEARLKEAVGLTEAVGHREVEEDIEGVRVKLERVDAVGEREAERDTVDEPVVERHSVNVLDCENEGKSMDGEEVKVAMPVVGRPEREEVKSRLEGVQDVLLERVGEAETLGQREKRGDTDPLREALAQREDDTVADLVGRVLPPFVMHHRK